MTLSPVTMPLGQQFKALAGLRYALTFPSSSVHRGMLDAACSGVATAIFAPYDDPSTMRPLPEAPSAAWRAGRKLFAQAQGRVQGRFNRLAHGMIDRALLKREEITFKELEGYACMGLVAEKAVRAFNSSAAHYLGRQLAEADLTMGAVWHAAIEYGASTGPSRDSWCALQHFFEMTPLPSPKLPGPNDVTNRSTDMSKVCKDLGVALAQNALLLARYGTPYASLWCEKQDIDDDLIARAVQQGVVSEEGAQQLHALRAASERTERVHRVLIRSIGALGLVGTIAVWAHIFNYADASMHQELKTEGRVALPIILSGFLFGEMLFGKIKSFLRWFV